MLAVIAVLLGTAVYYGQVWLFSAGLNTTTDCENWLTLEFFSTATSREVANCLTSENDSHGIPVAYRPLYLAASYSTDPKIIDVLVDVGMVVDGQRSATFWTPLHSAARDNENINIIRALLAAGADAGALDASGHTALDLAAQYNDNSDIVELLMFAEHGRIDTGKCSLWNTRHFFRTATPDDVIQCLRAGKDLHSNLLAPYGTRPMSPLQRAAAYSVHPEVITILLEGGAEVDGGDEKFGFTPLHDVSTNMSAAILSIVSILLGTDADVNAVTRPNRITPLHTVAAYNPNVSVTQALLDAGSDVDAQTESGDTPLKQAVAYNENPMVVRALLDAGANVNLADNYGTTPLHWAVESGHVDIVNMLLEAGADVIARESRGETPLHRAVAVTNNGPIVELLLAAGANPKAQNEDGKLPSDVAVNDNYLDLLGLDLR